MKAIFTFLTLPVIILICFLSGKFYISGDYVVAYSMVLTWFASLILWINYVSYRLHNQRA
ncbi:hypothetical protein ACQ86N_17305 [Puia sp. P3]|uniref:hypothetical protein n=1 Tax=Puia sp. P3 TaxID=3423952 RepID=UPI003D678C03